MQDSRQVLDTVETPVAAPFELTAEQLQLVGGGAKVGPNDSWAVAGPNDSW